MVVGRWAARWWRFAAGAVVAAAAAGVWPTIAAVAHELPAETMGPVTLPTVTLPPVTLPPVTLPPVTLPPVSTPEITTPALSTPIAEVPSLSVPSVTLPPVAIGGGVTATTPAPGVAPAAAGATPGEAPVGELPATIGAGSPEGAVGPDADGTPAAGAPAATTATEVGPLAVRLRQAASETVGRLSFPLGLAVAIASFLLVQHRLDRDDPRMTPAGPADDELLEFS